LSFPLRLSHERVVRAPGLGVLLALVPRADARGGKREQVGAERRVAKRVAFAHAAFVVVARVRASEKPAYGLGTVETEPRALVGVGVAFGVPEAAPAAAAGAAPAAAAGGGAGDGRAGGGGAELRGAGDGVRGLGHGGRRAARLDARRGRWRSCRDAAPFPPERAPHVRGSLELSLDRRHARARGGRLEVRRGVDAVVFRAGSARAHVAATERALETSAPRGFGAANGARPGLRATVPRRVSGRREETKVMSGVCFEKRRRGLTARFTRFTP
jgi:hypothetical protein